MTDLVLPLTLAGPAHPPDAEPARHGIPDGRGEAPSAMPVLTFTVHGLPAPQGSKKGFVVNGRAVLVESSKRVRPWREAVKHAALDALTTQAFTARVPLTGPLYVETTFTLPRPKAHYRTGRNAHLLRDNAPAWPAGKPDLDKLARTRDALTDAGVFRDDAQIVVELNVKTYPGGHADALPSPGAVVRIWRVAACETPERRPS